MYQNDDNAIAPRPLGHLIIGVFAWTMIYCLVIGLETLSVVPPSVSVATAVLIGVRMTIEAVR